MVEINDEVANWKVWTCENVRILKKFAKERLKLYSSGELNYN
jgi:hypothetical protein